MAIVEDRYKPIYEASLSINFSERDLEFYGSQEAAAASFAKEFSRALTVDVDANLFTSIGLEQDHINRLYELVYPADINNVEVNYGSAMIDAAMPVIILEFPELNWTALFDFYESMQSDLYPSLTDEQLDAYKQFYHNAASGQVSGDDFKNAMIAVGEIAGGASNYYGGIGGSYYKMKFLIDSGVSSVDEWVESYASVRSSGEIDTAYAISLPVFDGERFPSLTELEDAVIDTYMALFDRAPEYNGFQYWVNEIESFVGKSKEQFAAQDISTAKLFMGEQAWAAAINYSDLTGYSDDTPTFEFVSQVYSNVLGRPDAKLTDVEGIEYWSNKLDNGEIQSRGEFIAQVNDFARDYIDTNPNDPVSIYVSDYLDRRQSVSSFFAQEAISGGLSDSDAYSKGVQALSVLENHSTYDTDSALQFTINIIGSQAGYDM